jgi:uncharacterized protein YggU (UPF0235/DUF167 family)
LKLGQEPDLKHLRYGRILSYVRQRAVDGAANEAVIDLLARHFRVEKSPVEIIRGAAIRYKILRIN